MTADARMTTSCPGLLGRGVDIETADFNLVAHNFQAKDGADDGRAMTEVLAYFCHRDDDEPDNALESPDITVHRTSELAVIAHAVAADEGLIHRTGEQLRGVVRACPCLPGGTGCQALEAYRVASAMLRAMAAGA